MSHTQKRQYIAKVTYTMFTNNYASKITFLITPKKCANSVYSIGNGKAWFQVQFV